MKNRKKIRLWIVLASLIGIMGFSTVTMADSIVVKNSNANSGGDITLYSDILEWKYKFVDGVLYRRLYNHTKQTWVGEWEKV